MNKYNPEEDGKTHINAYSKSRNEYGRFLSNWYDTNYMNFYNIKFASLEGAWFYLKTGDKKYAKLKGYQAKAVAKKDKVDSDLDHIEQKIIFLDLLYGKLLSKIMWILKSPDLPIVHYYVYSGKVIEAGPDWYVDFLNKATSQLKEDWKLRIEQLKLNGYNEWYNEHYFLNQGAEADSHGNHPVMLWTKQAVGNSKLIWDSRTDLINETLETNYTNEDIEKLHEKPIKELNFKCEFDKMVNDGQSK